MTPTEMIDKLEHAIHELDAAEFGDWSGYGYQNVRLIIREVIDDLAEKVPEHLGPEAYKVEP